MTQFSVPWIPRGARTNYGFPVKAVAVAAVLLIVAGVGFWIAEAFVDGHPAATLLFSVSPLLLAIAVALAAFFVKTWRM